MTEKAHKTRRTVRFVGGISARVLCCVLSGILTVTCFHILPCLGTVAPISAEESVEELTEQKEALAKQQAELEAQRSDSVESLAEQEEQRNILQQQIEVKSQEIAVNQQLTADLDNQIEQTTTAISAQEMQIALLDKQIESQFAELQARLRAISKQGMFSSSLRMVMNSEDYAGYLLSAKLAERISQKDQALMDTLEQNLQNVRSTKASLESDKQALVTQNEQAKALREEIESDKQTLQTLYHESDEIVLKLGEDIAMYDETIAQIEAKQASMQNTIDEVMARIAAEEEARRQEEQNADDEDDDDDDDEEEDFTPSYNFQSGSMYWPAPSCTVITSSFKYREQFGRWHYGLDIACYGDATGQSIVAAADGTVMYANAYDTYGGGYGLYLIIDHGYDEDGQRILSLYAHCDAVVAYEGQSVSAGDLIAYVGDTGESYGAHLHFEVRVDGTAVDPISYGYLSTSGIDVLG